MSLAGATVKISGAENIPKEGISRLYFHHQGNFDIPLLLGFIDKPKAFIAKVEILKLPLIRTWMKHMNCVFMDRSDIRQSLKTIGTAAERVKTRLFHG